MSKRYILVKDLPGVKAPCLIKYNQDGEFYSPMFTGGYKWSRGIVEGDDGTWFKLEEVIEPKKERITVRVLPHENYGDGKWMGFYVIEPTKPIPEQKLMPIKKAIEAILNDESLYVTLEKVVAEYKSRPFNQKQFEKDMLQAASFFGKNILCEECGEIGKHKITCPQYCTVSPSLSRPPLGIMPEWRHKELRLEEIREALTRFNDHHNGKKEAPKEWLDEKHQIEKWLVGRIKLDKADKPFMITMREIASCVTVYVQSRSLDIFESPFFKKKTATIDFEKLEEIINKKLDEK